MDGIYKINKLTVVFWVKSKFEQFVNDDWVAWLDLLPQHGT
jgi:hypothetical protein